MALSSSSGSGRHERKSADALACSFGMRTFRQDEESKPKGKFYLNGREIRLRGANTMGHLERCVMEGNLDQLRDDILLAKLTNMNFLRLTQRPVHREVYDMCDRLGLLLQTDMPMFATVRRNQLLEVVRQCSRMERMCGPSFKHSCLLHQRTQAGGCRQAAPFYSPK